MVEWLILLLVVPAVAVPVVLLAGFAGCGFTLTFHVPKIEDAVGRSVSSIALTISYTTALRGFEFERKKIPELTVETFTVDASSAADTFEKTDSTRYLVVDRELQTKSLYLYRVRAIDSDGDFSSWSNAIEPDILAETLDFQTTAFEWTPAEKLGTRDAPGWAGFSYVQRIEAGRLTASGDNVRLTLHASSASSASIERVYISQPAAGPGSDPYDAAGDLTAVSTTAIMVPQNDRLRLTAQYHLDETQALLVCIDFGAARSEILATDPVPETDSVGYQKQAAADQAQLQDRTGFTKVTGIRLIEKIEVG